jgi:hypothetical protein
MNAKTFARLAKRMSRLAIHALPVLMVAQNLAYWSRKLAVNAQRHNRQFHGQCHNIQSRPDASD